MAQVATVAVVLASGAATLLLLSGWTPGPHSSTPQPVAAATTPVVTAPPKKPKPRTTPTATTATTPPAVAPPTAQQVAKETFQGQCGFCHTLADAGTSGRVGPNLDRLKPTKQRVLAAIAAGGRRTGLMPPDLVNGNDAVRVATYVAKASRR